MRNVVVLPQPLGPSSATMLPGSMPSETRSTARVAPKILVGSARRSAAGAEAGTRSRPEDFVVFFDEVRPGRVDQDPVGVEDLHLVHLRLGIRHVFLDLRLETETAERGSGQGLLGKQLLHVG